MRYFLYNNSEKTENKSCYSIFIFFLVKNLKATSRLLRGFCGFGLAWFFGFWGFLEREEENCACDSAMQIAVS